MIKENPIWETRKDEMKIVICDNEPMFILNMESMLRRYEAQNNITFSITTFSSPQMLLRADLTECDALFLDIEMQTLNGIETAKILRKKYKTLILVFVTRWIEYAPSGYRVEAFRYLLKKDLARELPICLREITEKLESSNAKILVSTVDGPISIQTQNIVFIEGTNHRSVLVYMNKNATVVECYGKLLDFENKLSDSGFLRIQRSYLVNMHYIQKITNYIAFLNTGVSLKVSERNYSQVCKEFLLWRGRQL